MNENDLREALHTTVLVAPAPPPMDSAIALGAGRRTVRRRRVAMAAAVAAVTFVAVGAGLPQLGGAAPFVPAAQPSTPPAPSVTDPKPSWPAPQEDATAKSGPRAEQGQKVLDGILALAPSDYTTPGGESAGYPMRDRQAAIDGPAWSYQARAALAKDGGTGLLLVEVHTKGNGLPAEPCALARTFWGMPGTCQVVRVGQAKVGVVVEPGADKRLDQWAAYRYPDGTVVFAAQSRSLKMGGAGLSPLAKEPLSVPQLAKVATDTRFRLS
jgi:hypothetical protein